MCEGAKGEVVQRKNARQYYTHIHINVHIHTYIHTYIHIHIYKYIYVCTCI
jgi:hypothetical protein